MHKLLLLILQIYQFIQLLYISLLTQLLKSLFCGIIYYFLYIKVVVYISITQNHYLLL